MFDHKEVSGVMDAAPLKPPPAAFPPGQTKINFSWSIHIACNYRCSYCGLFVEGNGAENNRYPPHEELVALWDRVHEKYGSVHIDIGMGEPTIYPRFLDLVAEITKKHSISITTNLSLGMDFWESFSRNVKGCYITTSFHPQYAKLEEFIGKVLFLQRFFPIKVVCVAWPPHVPRLLAYKRMFKEKGISFRVQAFWGCYAGQEYPETYTEEERDAIRMCSEDLENVYKAQIQYQLGEKETLGRPCRTGQVFAVIMNDGTVYRCSLVRTESLGNIYDGSLRLLEEPRACPMKKCLCEWKFLADLSPEEAKAVAGGG